MSREKKQISAREILVLFGTILFVLHFILILSYTLPSQFVPEKAEFVSKRYVNPFFYQGWMLFAPDLEKIEGKMEYRYFVDDKKWSRWVDPDTLQGRSSQAIRKIPAKILTVMKNEFSTKLYYLDDEPQFDAIEHSRRYYQLLRYIRNHQQLNSPEPADSLQVKFTFRKAADTSGSNLQKRTFILPSISTNQ